MARIDTNSAPRATWLRRSLFALAPLTLLLGACGGVANVDGAGGDPSEDPANIAHVDGIEGQDPGWATAAQQAEHDGVLAETAKIDAAPQGDIGHSSEALSTGRGAKLFSEASRELATLDVPTSYYTHTTYMNESTGTRRTDCSGFVDYVMTRTQPTAFKLVPHNSGARPLADDWYNYLAGRSTTSTTSSAGSFRRIARVQDLKPGDLVVWLTPSDVVSNNTGHIMIVRVAPTKGSRAGEWLVPIMDSTSSPHSTADSRGKSHTGPGQGTIGLKVDGSGAAVAYYWSGGYSSKAEYTDIALGRLE